MVSQFSRNFPAIFLQFSCNFSQLDLTPPPPRPNPPPSCSLAQACAWKPQAPLVCISSECLEQISHRSGDSGDCTVLVRTPRERTGISGGAGGFEHQGVRASSPGCAWKQEAEGNKWQL